MTPVLERRETISPPFQEDVFNFKVNDVCVVVFVLDEGDRFLRQLRLMQKLRLPADVIVADGGSSDGSTEPSTLASLGVNTLLTKLGGGALGTQMRIAFAWALERGYSGVVTIDGNGKDDPSAIPGFVRLLRDGYDHIQGSRFIDGGSHENTPWHRLVGVRALHAPLISMASGFKYSDTTNGFRGYSARLLCDSAVDVFRDIFSGYELHYYLAIEAPRKGYRCIEYPVARNYPGVGKIPTKITPLKGNLNVLWKLFKAVVGCYRIKPK